MSIPHKILFLNLLTFSGTGGIEKFNRAFLKSLSHFSQLHGSIITGMSLHDGVPADEAYFPAAHYRSYHKSTPAFLSAAFRQARQHDCIVLAHINLAPIGLLIKKLFPGKRIILLAHGLEVWDALDSVKKKLLGSVDEIWSVSNYTKQQIVTAHGVQPRKIKIFPNTIDPYFAYPSDFRKPAYLLERHDTSPAAKVILSVTRLSSGEKYKGYDTIIKTLPDVLKQHPDAVYWIGGKSDAEERLRVEKIINDTGLTDRVKLLGFIPDEELIDHYLAADVYAMPSRKEGFGIVFIEAMACGLPVIAGNLDGSRDALRNGELGTLINPNDIQALTHAIINTIHHLPDTAQKAALQEKVRSYFGFTAYERLMESHLSFVQ